MTDTESPADSPVDSPADSPVDWGRLYRDHVDAVTSLVADLDEATLASTVPATPQWSVHDVLAHAAGVAADSVSGRTDGAPSPAWTAVHVGERSDWSVFELVAELTSLRDDVVAGFGEGPQGTVFDLSTHHADLHEALGRGPLHDHLWRPVYDAVGNGLPEGTDTGDVPAYELWRARFSRRSRAQTAAWGLGVPQETLDEMCVFGPREDDQPIPAAG